MRLNRKIKLRDPQLAAILALTYVPDLAILIVWLTNSPLEPVMVETGTVQSLRCVTRSGGFAWGLFGYGLAKLLVALRFTYLTRNVYSKYNETKSVLFAVYTVMVGIAIAIASFAVQDLGREGQIILLLIALSSASIGTSTAIAGYRIFFALQDGEGISSQTTGASPGMTAKKPSPTKSNPIATSSAPWANATTGSERAYGETQLKGFHASIRERRLWFSRWTACWICTSHGGSLIISFVKNEKGGTAEWFHGLKLDVLRFIRSIKADAASNSATQYFGVEIGAPTTSYEIVFESEGAASDFMKECEHLVNNAPADSTE
ncbi:hypothetical protein HK102_013955 [Quaeritorhiza haematococci]|nr:hypothetical protein HK102_013955 [Quaeritorhiza haematococci]